MNGRGKGITHQKSATQRAKPAKTQPNALKYKYKQLSPSCLLPSFVVGCRVTGNFIQCKIFFLSIPPVSASICLRGMLPAAPSHVPLISLRFLAMLSHSPTLRCDRLLMHQSMDLAGGQPRSIPSAASLTRGAAIDAAARRSNVEDGEERSRRTSATAASSSTQRQSRTSSLLPQQAQSRQP